jgi:hypothetical protein
VNNEFLTTGNPCSAGYIFEGLQEETQIMKLVQVKIMRLVQVHERYVKDLNAENKTKICLLDSQILMLMEKRGHYV